MGTWFFARRPPKRWVFGRTAEIDELCARLEDTPLAVELAAARAASLSPRQILDRLGQRLDVLKGGRDTDPRQRTLRATIEWSHELLAPDQQRLFRRLSVFAGGTTLDGVESVCDRLAVAESVMTVGRTNRDTDGEEREQCGDEVDPGMQGFREQPEAARLEAGHKLDHDKGGRREHRD